VASGALAADAATVSGTATHLTLHESSGALAAQDATVDGTAVHTGGAAQGGDPGPLPHIGLLLGGIPEGTHPSTGSLVADSATLSGSAELLSSAFISQYPFSIPVAWYADPGFVALWGRGQEGIPIENRDEIANASSGALVADAATVSG
jgi:hypothetical protein